MFSHILLASDGSECALKAAETAATVAATFASRLTVLNVFKPAPYIGAFEAPTELGLEPKYIAEIQDDAIRSTGRILKDHSVPFDCKTEIGDPSDEIIRTAEEQHCDLIIMGSRGLSGIKSLVLGSVSDQVTHHAHCPVLIVK